MVFSPLAPPSDAPTGTDGTENSLIMIHNLHYVVLAKLARNRTLFKGKNFIEISSLVVFPFVLICCRSLVAYHLELFEIVVGRVHIAFLFPCFALYLIY